MLENLAECRHTQIKDKTPPKLEISKGVSKYPLQSSKIFTFSLIMFCKGSLKKTKKHLDGLSPQWGGGFRAESTFACFFFTFNVKIMSKNWKRTIKQW